MTPPHSCTALQDANIESSAFYQDEIIVYSESQARIRYVVRLKL